MKIQFPSISQQETWESGKRFLASGLEDMAHLLNGALTFSDNFNAQFIGVTFGTANAEVIVNHSLKKVPQGYLVINRNAALTVYDSSTVWTTSNIYLKASATGFATVMVF